MKLERRMLVVVKAFRFITTVLLRGVLGVEHVAIFDSCKDLIEFLKSKKGVAGEINAVITVSNACREYLENSHVELLDVQSLPKVLKERVSEAIELAIRVGANARRGMIEVLRADK